MKLIHLSDLHLGKKVNGFPMLEDQKYILGEILNIIDGIHPDGIIIAGDVYDKAVPPAEAVELLDKFLVSIVSRKLPVFMISGNHDSAERLAFGNKIMNRSGVYISPAYDGNIQPIPMKDEFGIVDIYLLPFIKPIYVRRFFPDREVSSYQDAVRLAVENMSFDEDNRKVLVAHQFITGADRTDSEDIVIGGIDNVDAGIFASFDYVALGHLHGPQNVGSERIRYCGTPLKYSFSEADQIKSLTLIELREKGNFSVTTFPLKPCRDMREIWGTYEEVTQKSFYEGTSYDRDYMHITLTDEDEIPYAAPKLRKIYPNLMRLDYDNMRTKRDVELTLTTEIDNKSPEELFSIFFRQQNNLDMTGLQKDMLEEALEKIGGEEV
jgi:exonuclease SbcD